ncbi:MAG: hypothetical protein R3Y63_13095 [Eubacteriales bacterium]
MKKIGIALSLLFCFVLLTAFAMTHPIEGYYLDFNEESRENQEEMAKIYDLQEQIQEKLQELSYDTVVTITQGGEGCLVWVYVSAVVESETQAEEIAQTIRSFGAEFSLENITISDWEGATWWNLSENWSKTLTSG